MSFGSSVGDVVMLAKTVLHIYKSIKSAPGVCQAFAAELLQFHGILSIMATALQGSDRIPLGVDEDALIACLESCEELIYVRVCGGHETQECVRTFGKLRAMLSFSRYDSHGTRFTHDWGPSSWKYRWRERKFAAQVPELQRAVAAHTQNLIAFNTLIIRSDQLKLFDCSERAESLHDQALAYLRGPITVSQSRLEATSERLEQSQARMEAQMGRILDSQQHRQKPILSQSLDASSPEGRETWMNLGRLLKAEGIMPAMVQQNSNLLVNAMKTTLDEDSLAHTPASYHTAFESFSDHHRTFTGLSSSRPSLQASVNILGSAPPRGATFTDEFLDRHRGAARSLDQIDNVEEGMQSLLQGMEPAQEKAEKEALGAQDDDMDLLYYDWEGNGKKDVPKRLVYNRRLDDSLCSKRHSDISYAFAEEATS